MSTYLISMPREEGVPIEIEADFYGQEGDDFVFTADGIEVRRVPMSEVGSITKCR